MTRLLPNIIGAITLVASAFTTATSVGAQAIESAGLESFGVLAASTVTNALGPDTSIIDGNLGLYAGTAITGFGFPTSCVSGGPGQVLPPSVCHLADAVAKNAQNDWSIAYGTLASAPATADLTGKDLGTVGTLKAGVYNFASSAQLTGTLTLDGQGNPNALFIFKIKSTLTTASGSTVKLINGAQGRNVFFQVGASATLGTGTQFAGDILALASISMNADANINCGAALAHTGAVTLIDNEITICRLKKATVGSVVESKSTEANELAVAAALDSFVAHGGTLPPEFQELIGLLSPAQLAAALTQLSGEVGSAVAPAGTQAMNSFMSLVFHRFENDFGESPGTPRTDTVKTLDYGPDDPQASKARSAFASFDAPDPSLWNSWAAAYGGESQNPGDLEAGTHDRFASVFGIAGGLDYRVTPETMVGFALSGGATDFHLSDNLGSGHGNLLQAAVYSRTKFGPADAAYVATALAYGRDSVSTDRLVTVLGVDELTAKFSAQDFAGQVEGGYRFRAPNIPGLPGDGWFIPYAALRGQAFSTPAYKESAISGSSAFALAYQAQTTTTARSELGTRMERAVPVDGEVLLLDTRVAWAHYYGSNPAITAMFQALPGSIFTVNGAATATDSVLVSAGAEMRFNRAFSVATSFDGEFADGSQDYGGSIWLRHTW